LADWTRINVADGTWTKNDPDDHVTNISNTGGINSVDIDDTGNSNYINGCIFYKEIRLANGGPFDFTDRPADLRGYVHWPGTGWQDDGSQAGGGDKPPIASKCYCILGFTTDPENFPDDASSSDLPRDMCGAGLEWTTNNNKLKRQIIRNVSNAGVYGAISKNTTYLDTITSADVSAGHKASNRLEWQTEIVKAEHLASGSLTPAGAPRSYYMMWSDRYDNGDRRNINQYALDQRWGRTRTDKLYAFVAVGRNATGGDALTMEFDIYYHARLLQSGTSPSGKTALSGP
jgi:hypothetical protein